ncbi:hypothetical protein C8R44DRAFT_180886 [Mycena epipterygia]|nr:hypothetical protein C8R44DRAFT_180886 [Mycena epipterygia]
MSSSRSHPPGCLCSNCHLSSRLFPRGPNDRIILPAVRPTPDNTPKSPTGNDRARFAPPRPQSTAPHEYRPRQQPPPPMPAPPRGYDDHSRRSMDTHNAPPMHRPVPTHANDPRYNFAPPDRPASAMANPSHRPQHQRHHSQHVPQQQPQQQQQQQQQEGARELEWMPPRLKWVKKKERVSHFTPPSQFQGTSFRQYVHDGVTRNQ